MTIADLKAKIAELNAKAKAKRAELRDDTSRADAERINVEHEAICADLGPLNRELIVAEVREGLSMAPAAADRADDPDVVTRERERVDTIRSDLARYTRGPGGDNMNLANLAAGAIRSGTTPADFRLAVLERMAAEDDRHPINSNSPGSYGGSTLTRSLQVTRDETDTRRRGMQDAIVARLQEAGGQRPEVPDHARHYMGHTLAELAAEAVGHRGQLTSRAVEGVMQRAFHTTSDFPAIFGGAINARLLQRYQIATPAFRRFAAPRTNPDFRSAQLIRPGDFPTLQPIQESGEIKSGTFGESKEQLQVFPFGVLFNLSRQMLVNDNLGAIDQLLAGAGDRVSLFENDTAFTLLLSAAGAGPTLLTDSTAVFHTNHGNLAGAGGDIDVTTVGAGFAAMSKQVSIDGLKLNLAPVTLMTGPDKALKAGQLVTSITPAQTSNAVPDSIKRLAVVSDANITGNAWYLWADPAAAPVFAAGTLEGFTGPRLSIRDEWGVQGISVRLEHDFGVSAVDYRGAWRNPGP